MNASVRALTHLLCLSFGLVLFCSNLAILLDLVELVLQLNLDSLYSRMSNAKIWIILKHSIFILSSFRHAISICSVSLPLSVSFTHTHTHT